MYEQCIRELVMSCFDGYNAAVLAYGQTGSTLSASQVARPSPWAPLPPTSPTSPPSASSPEPSTISSGRSRPAGREAQWRSGPPSSRSTTNRSSISSQMRTSRTPSTHLPTQAPKQHRHQGGEGRIGFSHRSQRGGGR